MTETEVDRSKIKLGALGALSVLAALYFGYEFSKFALAPQGGRIAPLFVSLCVWLIFAVLQVFLIKSVSIGSFLAVLEAAAVWITLHDKTSYFNSGGALIMLFFLVSAFAAGNSEVSDSLRIKFFRTARRAAGIALTGIVFFATLYFLGTLKYPNISISKDAFAFFLSGSDVIAKKVIPGFAMEAPVDIVLEAVLKSQAPEGVPDALIKQNIPAFRKEIAAKVGIALSGQEKLIDVLYRSADSKLKGLPEMVQILVLAGIGIVAFGILKTITFFIGLIVITVGFVAYQIMIALNVIHLANEQKSKEVIVVS